MKSNETKASAKTLIRTAAILGAISWVLGFFGLYMALPKGAYAVFVILSAVLLIVFLKLRAMGAGAPGLPKPIYLTVGLVFFAVQILFFGALTILGLEALPWAQRLFFCITGLYLMGPLVAAVGKST